MPEEEDSLDGERAPRRSAEVIGPVNSGGFKSGETVAISSSSSLIGEGGDGLLKYLQIVFEAFLLLRQ